MRRIAHSVAGLLLVVLALTGCTRSGSDTASSTASYSATDDPEQYLSPLELKLKTDGYADVPSNAHTNNGQNTRMAGGFNYITPLGIRESAWVVWGQSDTERMAIEFANGELADVLVRNNAGDTECGAGARNWPRLKGYKDQEGLLKQLMSAAEQTKNLSNDAFIRRDYDRSAMLTLNQGELKGVGATSGSSRTDARRPAHPMNFNCLLAVFCCRYFSLPGTPQTFQML